MKVELMVEEIVKDKKVITLKVRRRKNSRNIKGFRRELTVLRVQDIKLNTELENDLV
jgi:ribosomal protein L21